MVVAADDMRDLHLDIVDHHAKIVGRRAVRAEDDQVVDRAALEDDLSFHQVVDDDLPLRRGFEPDGGFFAGNRRGQQPAAAVVPGDLSLRHRLFPARLQLFRRAVAAVGFPFGQKGVDPLPVDLEPVGLSDWIGGRSFPLVPVEPEPAHPVDDGFDGGVGRPGAVGVLDSQKEFSPMVPGEKPVEKGCPRPADVKETGRAGGEPDANIRHYFSFNDQSKNYVIFKKKSKEEAGEGAGPARRGPDAIELVGLFSSVWDDLPISSDLVGFPLETLPKGCIMVKNQWEKYV